MPHAKGPLHFGMRNSCHDLALGWSIRAAKANCILALLAVGGPAVASAEIVVVEAVNGPTATNVTLFPPYGEITGNWSSSSVKSSVDPASRFGSRSSSLGTPAFKLQPTLAEAGGTYYVEMTLGSASSISANIVVGISTVNGSGLPATTDGFQQAKGVNAWYRIGTLALAAGQSTPTITFTYSNGTLSRFYADAFRFVNTNTACITGLPELDVVNGPLQAGQPSVAVPGVSASATNVSVYADNVLIGQLRSGIVVGNNVVTTVPLVKGQQITASQWAGGIESCRPSAGPLVGGGPNPRVRVVLSIRQNTALTGPIGADGTTAGTKIVFLGTSNLVSGLGNAPAGGKVIQPGGCWQTVSFLRGSDPVHPIDPTFAWSGADGQPLNGNYGVLEAIAFAIDDLTDTGPFRIYIDKIMNGSTIIQDFESANAGVNAVVFNQPGLSTTTSPFLLAPSSGAISPNISQVSNAYADSGTNSALVSWQFRDVSAASWLRLVTQGSGTPNPEVDLNQPISFRMLLLRAGETNVGSPVTITAQPPSRIAHANDDVMLSVSATGPALGFQWYNDGAAIPNANSSTFEIPSVQAGDVGSYTARIISGDSPSCDAISDAAVLSFLSEPASIFVVDFRLMTLAVTEPASVAATYQWSKSTDGGANYTPIDGATNATYSQYVRFYDTGTRFRITLSLPGGSLMATTYLHVEDDPTPPVLISAGAYDPLHVGIRFNERMDFSDVYGDGTANASNYIAYSDSGAAYTFSAVIPRTNSYMSEFGQIATLVSDTLMPPGHYTLYAYSFADLVGNLTGYGWDEETGIIDFTTQSLTPIDIGVAGTNGAGVYNAAAIPIATLGMNPFTGTNGSFDVVANGWDIWNGNDGFHFDLARTITGNFDLKVRVQALLGADQWSKAGLMARVNTNSTSRFAAMLATPATTPVSGQAANNFFSFQWRDVDAAVVAPAESNINGVPPVPYPNAWVRLQRLGSVFKGYQSSNGVDWVLVGNRDTALSPTGVFPDTLLIGLSTVSHDQQFDGLSRNSYAEYREFNIPNPPTITLQPGPLAITQAVNTAISFSVTATNPANSGPLIYQWLKNGVPIPNATNDTLVFVSLKASDSGTYTVDPANNGGGVASLPFVLVVCPTNESVPVIMSCPSNQVIECTSAAGAIATFTTPAAIDICDSSPTVICTPASGSTFPVGTNTVTCIAYDVSLNTNSCTFTVTVADASGAPTLTIVPSGANVIISWLATCTTYDLEKATVLPNWGPSGASMVLDGARYYSTNVVTGTVFYRLHKM